MTSPAFPKRWLYRFSKDTGLESLYLEAGQPNPAGETWFNRPDEAMANAEKPENRKENPMAKKPAPNPKPRSGGDSSKSSPKGDGKKGC
jgi:hypothetical protein